MSAAKFQTAASLSDRELEILDLVANGLTNQEISEKLEISKRTVDNHRVELVRWALHWGKVCLDDINCCILPSPAPTDDQVS
jgi:DNA-binding CsgD family transcriptional regulator